MNILRSIYFYFTKNKGVKPLYVFSVDYFDVATHMAKKNFKGVMADYLALSPESSNQLNIVALTPESAALQLKPNAHFEDVAVLCRATDDVYHITFEPKVKWVWHKNKNSNGKQ